MTNAPDSPHNPAETASAPAAPLLWHDGHAARGARFGTVAGQEVVLDYGANREEREYRFLTETVGVLDLGYRSRLCVTGADRQRFLHGQVTNAVKDLRPGDGCYAALVTAKGRMVSDLQIHCLKDELLLDLEPGCGTTVRERLEAYVIADDAQIVDVTPHYTLWSLQGPAAAEVLAAAGLAIDPLPAPGKSAPWHDPHLGEICCARIARGTVDGFDLFVPNASAEALASRLLAEAERRGGGAAGWNALELVRVEAGLPRFGQDMDATHLPPEAGLEARAISYSKGCYIGQEVIARIRTYGQVTKALRGLVLPDDLASLPAKGTRLFLGDKEVGTLTSVIRSPRWHRNLALGYVRKECHQPGTELELETPAGRRPARIVPLPFNAP